MSLVGSAGVGPGTGMRGEACRFPLGVDNNNHNEEGGKDEPPECSWRSGLVLESGEYVPDIPSNAAQLGGVRKFRVGTLDFCY